jgi:galactokinase
VVPIALNLRTRIRGKATNTTKVRVRSKDLEREGQAGFDEFDIKDTEYRKKGWFGNYIRATVNALKKQGYSRKIKGADITIESDVPIGAGLGSSGALEVAAVKFFDAAFKLNLSKHDIAGFAYTAEREELGIPCGRLDQYASSFGGVIYLETLPPYRVEELPFKSFYLTVIDSGIRHSTAEIHPKRQRELDKGLHELLQQELPETTRKKLGANHADTKWQRLKETELTSYLKRISPRNANRILFTLRSQRATMIAARILRKQAISERELSPFLGENASSSISRAPRQLRSLIQLGAIINYQHELLRDLYELSLPRLEELRDAAIGAGACGVKLSGAGIGGCLVALTRTASEASKILKEALTADAVNGWVCTVDKGARIDRVSTARC